jgi:TRAP-type mannitol/chloroaromatic compound transport system substrate-binding protein
MTKLTRRGFLGSGASVLAGATAGTTLGMPSLVRAEPEFSFRFQSTWPSTDIFHEFAQDFAKKINEMSGARLRIEVLPANSVVKAFGLLSAVHKGHLDGGHGVTTYWFDSHPAFGLFGGGPAFGMDANTLLAWMAYGGGQKLYDELMHRELGLNVQGFLYGPMPAQPLGWFRQAVRKPADLKGLKFRSVGLAAEMFKELGVQPVSLPAADIVPWLERELIDAAEFNNPSSDRALGFPAARPVCMLRSWHQPAEVFEVLFNRQRFESLPFELRSMLRYALQASSADMSWKLSQRYPDDFEEMSRRQGVRYYRSSDELLQVQLSAWRRVLNREAEKTPLFRKIMESQMRFAKKAVGYQVESQPQTAAAYDFWFNKHRNSEAL